MAYSFYTFPFIYFFFLLVLNLWYIKLMKNDVHMEIFIFHFFFVLLSNYCWNEQPTPMKYVYVFKTISRFAFRMGQYISMAINWLMCFGITQRSLIFVIVFMVTFIEKKNTYTHFRSHLPRSIRSYFLTNNALFRCNFSFSFRLYTYECIYCLYMGSTPFVRWLFDILVLAGCLTKLLTTIKNKTKMSCLQGCALWIPNTLYIYVVYLNASPKRFTHIQSTSLNFTRYKLCNIWRYGKECWCFSFLLHWTLYFNSLCLFFRLLLSNEPVKYYLLSGLVRRCVCLKK